MTIYKHAFMRDLVSRLLGSAEVDIVAAVKSEDFSPLLLTTLRPQVVVVDQAALEDVEGFARTALLCPLPDVSARVIVISLSHSSMLVWRKQVVANADAQKLLRAVGEAQATAAAPSSFHLLGSQADSGRP
jgi:hypothetical protein